MPDGTTREAARLIDLQHAESINVLGPTIQFLTPREEEDGPCIMRGALPPGGFVPLHSHPDPETFILMDGALEGLAETAQGFEWIPVDRGQVFHVPPNARHAWRNPARAPAVTIVITTRRMGEFFREIGKPASAAGFGASPTSREIRQFLETSARYGYWNATPEENARVGLPVPTFPGGPGR